MRSHRALHHLEQLEAYFSGQLAGEMGLRSSLGSHLTYGAHVQNNEAGGPGGGALRAARVTGRVEATLERITVAQRAVLAAYYGTSAPAAPWGLTQYGPIAPVACVLEDPERLRLLSACASSRSPCRSEAKSAVRRALARARAALERAQDAYCEAAESERHRRRRVRVQRFEEGLG